MEQSMLLATNQEAMHNECLTTPSRAQKRLFVPSSNSSKRSLFNEKKEVRNITENISDAESDLGPMSPLALTDHSSCDSSPGRQFISPLATPEKSPTIPLSNWDCMIPTSTNSTSKERLSPFSFLKRVTKSARSSPRRILLLSPKSKSSHSSQDIQAKSTITSSNSTNTIMSEEIVPETPGKESDFDDQLSYVAETPQKEDHIESNQITPLGSVYKNIPIPRIHRRKSLSSLEPNKCISPETKKLNFMRHLEDSLILTTAKVKKTEELPLIPRARAALFQENKNISKQDKEFTLNTKSFYGSNDKSNKSITVGWKDSQIDLKRKKSLSSHHFTQKKSIKRHRKGEINCGVHHGIRKPKLKRQSIQTDLLDTQKQIDNSNFSNNKNNVKENWNPKIRNQNDTNEKKCLDDKSNKKFFKSKFENKSNIATNNIMKSRSFMNQEEVEHINKKLRLDGPKFDASDLLIEEPSMQESLEPDKVDNILKILEDDWADDDEYDTTATEFITKKASPNNSNIRLKDLTMSPGSELSNMASTMNIDDISYPLNITSTSSNEISVQKYYPLFSKGYSSSFNDEYNNKKRKRSTNWQLSMKCSNSENQYQIDAGQKNFGATQCTECNIVYQIGDPDDENAHLNYHNSFKTLKFQGWKNERVVFTDFYTSSRIILVEPKDSNLYWKKVTEILEIVDRDLGLSDMKLSFYRDKKVFLCYFQEYQSVLVAEYIKSAFKMIPELVELNCCTSETTPVKCGVNVVWTAMSHRRQGIATKLVDMLRVNYYYGYIMSIDDIAFSAPTPSGKSFAEKYTKTRNFKVY
ncbi:N-acetyltransferase ESCO2-like isoform X2 [Phymastichus coffea]|uniref:N-acetyltransferase ESCO2-like isoform X2 n=1 Tax=Phymastichus coffea TaxID=108790 RepID=UPI00273A7AA7|nr:N-acetyltransferase ESCO2-like isoform X2 [Phymastichus coffea]